MFLVSIFSFSFLREENKHVAKHEKNHWGNDETLKEFLIFFFFFGRGGTERKNLNNGGDVDVALYLTIKISRDIFCCGENFWKKRLFFFFFATTDRGKGKYFKRTVGSKNIRSLGCFVIIVIKFFIKYIFVSIIFCSFCFEEWWRTG